MGAYGAGPMLLAWAAMEGRYTVPQAAQQLGISEGAVRTRLSRGKLESIREGDRVYVLLDTDTTRAQHDMPQSESSVLMSAKDETIATLREQLAAERRANEENRRLLAAALERIPQITGETSESPQESPPPVQREENRDAGEEASERSWWSRLFGR
jgi:hypothetical protein